MPTYPYLCQDCGHSFDLFQKITDAPAAVCPKCTSEKTQRQIAAGSGLMFQGSGYYQTDYKNPPASKPSHTCGSCSCGKPPAPPSPEK